MLSDRRRCIPTEVANLLKVVVAMEGCSDHRTTLPSSVSANRQLVLFPTALGWSCVVGDDAAIELVTFGHSTPEAARRAASLDGTRQQPNDERCALLDNVAGRIAAYFEGRRDNFADVPIRPFRPTAFRMAIWTACRSLDYGSTASYAELARRVGAPNAARAVGNALAANPVPIIVPCHRIIGSDGRIGSYSAPGGATMKRRLLTLEGVIR